MSKQPVDYPTSIRLTSELRAELVRLAEADGRSLTNYIANVLRLHVEQLKGGKSRGR
jgi:predicted DNA-binding protein